MIHGTNMGNPFFIRCCKSWASLPFDVRRYRNLTYLSVRGTSTPCCWSETRCSRNAKLQEENVVKHHHVRTINESQFGDTTAPEGRCVGHRGAGRSRAASSAWKPKVDAVSTSLDLQKACAHVIFCSCIEVKYLDVYGKTACVSISRGRQWFKVLWFELFAVTLCSCAPCTDIVPK
jgi:hypothetical protein